MNVDVQRNCILTAAGGSWINKTNTSYRLIAAGFKTKIKLLAVFRASTSSSRILFCLNIGIKTSTTCFDHRLHLSVLSVQYLLSLRINVSKFITSGYSNSRRSIDNSTSRVVSNSLKSWVLDLLRTKNMSSTIGSRAGMQWVMGDWPLAIRPSHSWMIFGMSIILFECCFPYDRFTKNWKIVGINSSVCLKMQFRTKV